MNTISQKKLEKLLEGESAFIDGEEYELAHISNDPEEDYDYIYGGEAIKLPKTLDEIDFEDEGGPDITPPDDVDIIIKGVRLYISMKNSGVEGCPEPIADFAAFDASTGEFLDSDLFYDWAQGVELILPHKRGREIFLCGNWLDPLNDDAKIDIELEPVWDKMP